MARSRSTRVISSIFLGCNNLLIYSSLFITFPRPSRSKLLLKIGKVAWSSAKHVERSDSEPMHITRKLDRLNPLSYLYPKTRLLQGASRGMTGLGP